MGVGMFEMALLSFLSKHFIALLSANYLRATAFNN